MVRLLPSSLAGQDDVEASFNPTMVRLLPLPCVALSCLPVFQSHNGAIAASTKASKTLLMSTFQSHNGAIAAAPNPQANFAPQPCFNPTMVRLLPDSYALSTLTKLLFQSHNGAIAAGKRLLTSLRAASVSIPQWCDCCCCQNQTLMGGGAVSIPQWCDCCRKNGCVQYSTLACFNPTMVRLLLAHRLASRRTSLRRFQSHNGAIAAR